ncbi:hypothetical protein AQUCO_02800255v1 [Aquilegia coerulea]|nr:hypothetical protein AQUCO_02800255v1 [Aquilegia coerulea]
MDFKTKGYRDFPPRDLVPNFSTLPCPTFVINGVNSISLINLHGLSMFSNSVEALNSIYSKLEMKGKIIEYDEKSCPESDSSDIKEIICECQKSESNTTCHVTALNYYSQECTGIISPTVADLVYLKELDLSNNMLHGSIPTSLWNLSKLEYL